MVLKLPYIIKCPSYASINCKVLQHKIDFGVNYVETNSLMSLEFAIWKYSEISNLIPKLLQFFHGNRL